MADLPHQSLYRRYRPQRFAEVRGQDHVTKALRNAVANGRTTHAYLFSGPRGTGKTSTARILAAALNCASPVEGEPCGVCDSCVSVRSGASFDVVEVDAASNNKIDEMRTLLERVALGSPGRWKVYIVDEVHMLSTGSSNALLKTLEEPPGHVIFVLATTDPQKVLPTIRSRTQHYEFRLLGAELLGELLADVNGRAELGLDPATLDRVVRRGNGSARDALSALDQAAAAGGAEEEDDSVAAVVEALVGKDAGAALVAVAEAARHGRDPHRLAVDTVEHLRTAFLLTMAPEVAGVPAHQRAELEDRARRLGPASTVRAMEVLGEALVAMRDSLDTRVTFELALVRLCAPKADTSPAAIVERLERLEARSALREAPAEPGGRSAPERKQPAERPDSPSAERPNSPRGMASARAGGAARPTIGAMRQRGPTVAGAPTSAPLPAEANNAPAGSGPPAVPLNRDELTKAWGDVVLAALPNGIKSIYRQGRWTLVQDANATFVLPNEVYRARAEEKRAEVEQALTRHFGTRVALRLEIEDGIGTRPSPARVAVAPAYDGPPPRDRTDLDEDVSSREFAQLEAAPDGPGSAEARLLEAFPGSEEISG